MTGKNAFRFTLRFSQPALLPLPVPPQPRVPQAGGLRADGGGAGCATSCGAATTVQTAVAAAVPAAQMAEPAEAAARGWTAGC